MLLHLIQRVAEEKAKKKLAIKRQEELEQKKKIEEEAKRKKIQQAVRLCSYILWSFVYTMYFHCVQCCLKVYFCLFLHRYELNPG